MQGIIRGLKALLPVIAQHPAATAMLTFCASLVLFVYGVSGNLDTLLRRFPSLHEEHELFDRVVVANGLVEAELERITTDMRADRTLVMQFHNGKQDLSGLPFTFAEITFGATSPGVVVDLRFLGPVPMSAYGPLLRAIWADPSRPVCIRRNIEDLGSPLLRARLEARGAKEVYVCPIVNLIGAPIGLITTEYLRLDTPRPSQEIIKQTLSESSNRIAGYLATTRIGSQRP